MNKINDFEIGDEVIITRAATERDWNGYCIKSMDCLIGRKVKITKIYSFPWINCRCIDVESLFVPLSILKKVQNKKIIG